MSTTFLVPVRIEWDGAEREIATVRDVLQFLRQWPVRRRGSAFSCAERSCHEAIAGQVPVETTRQAFESFARMSRILVANDMGEMGLLRGKPVHVLGNEITS